MNINLIKLVRISDFKPEDKKKIIDNFDKLSPEAILELWQTCLENLQWKLEIEFSKRFHESIFKGVIEKKDNTQYLQLEKEILLEIFTKAEVEARDEDIEQVRLMLHNIKKPAAPQNPSAGPSPEKADPVAVK